MPNAGLILKAFLELPGHMLNSFSFLGRIHDSAPLIRA